MKAVYCKAVGCNKIVTNDSSFCPKHREESDRRRKENSFKNATRYADYNSKEWKQLKKEILNDYPFCQNCGVSKQEALLHVHHIIPIRYAPQLFLERSNLQVLCESCHRLETQREIQERNKRK